MTKVEIILVTVSALTSASASVGFYLLHKRIQSLFEFAASRLVDVELAVTREAAIFKEGTKSEFQRLHSKVEMLDTEMHLKVEHVGHFIQKEVEKLKSL